MSLIKNFKKINDFFFIKVAHHWINGLLFAEFCESLQQAGVDRFSQVIFGCLSDRNWLNNTCRNKRYSLNESWSQFRLKIWVPVIMLQARCIFFALTKLHQYVFLFIHELWWVKFKFTCRQKWCQMISPFIFNQYMYICT